MRELLADLERAGLSSIKGSFKERMATDHSSSRVVVIRGGRARVIDHYHGNFRAPKSLDRIERMIDRALGTAAWIQR